MTPHRETTMLCWDKQPALFDKQDIDLAWVAIRSKTHTDKPEHLTFDQISAATEWLNQTQGWGAIRSFVAVIAAMQAHRVAR